MPNYCSVVDVRRAAGQSRPVTPAGEQEATITALIARASAYVDTITGTWFDSRSITIKTEASREGQTSLFVPAKTLSLTSVSENGALLTLANVLNYGGWLMKTGSAVWSPLPQSIVIIGSFGQTAIPEDIVQATAHLAAVMWGMVGRSYVTGDGIAQAVLDNSTPDWVKATLHAWTRPAFDQQAFVIS